MAAVLKRMETRRKIDSLTSMSNMKLTAGNRSTQLGSTSETAIRDCSRLCDSFTKRDFAECYPNYRSSPSLADDQLAAEDDNNRSGDAKANKKTKQDEPLAHQPAFSRPWETSAIQSPVIIRRPWDSSSFSMSVVSDPRRAHLARMAIDGDRTSCQMTDLESSFTTEGPSIDGDYSSVCSYPVEDRRRASLVESTGVTQASKARSGFSPSTIKILEAWYSANIHQPYMSHQDLAHVTSDAGITVQQARKWMANRRTRSSNTLTYSRAIHPQRLRYLLRHRQNPMVVHQQHQRQQQQQQQQHLFVSAAVSSSDAPSFRAGDEKSPAQNRFNSFPQTEPFPMTSTPSSSLFLPTTDFCELWMPQQNRNWKVGSHWTATGPEVTQRSVV